jgi:Hint domain/Nidogen-like
MAAIITGLGGPQGVGEGSVRGSTLTAGNYDDGSLRVNITSVFGGQGINYFGTNYTSMYINTNGLITFAAPNLSYTPTSLGGLTQPAIAPFWTDVDITTGSATGTNNIYYDLDPGTGRVTVTWLGVAAYSGGGANRNTFQVVLQHTSNGNFEIDINYNQIQWTNGGSGIAQAGMTDGGSNDFIIPGSGDAAALLGYPNAVIDPNDPRGVWSNRYLDGRSVCFVAGTAIATPDGPRRVEDLRRGDLVLTRDAGAKPVVWAGGGSILAAGDSAPICMAAGVLGAARELQVSGQHLILIGDRITELLFGEAEVLIAAKDLIGLPGVSQDRSPRIVGYYHVLLEDHHVLLAEGVASESFHPGKMALAHLSRRALADLRATVPDDDLARYARQPAARRVLKPHEARVMLAMLHQGDAASRIDVLLGLAA